MIRHIMIVTSECDQKAIPLRITFIRRAKDVMYMNIFSLACDMTGLQIMDHTMVCLLWYRMITIRLLYSAFHLLPVAFRQRIMRF